MFSVECISEKEALQNRYTFNRIVFLFKVFYCKFMNWVFAPKIALKKVIIYNIV